MTAIKGMLQEIAGLFVDDGWLALSILAVVALAAGVSLVPGASLVAGGVLLFGCLGALVANVVNAAQR
jgi:uncharacterized membrane protein YdjX (TVP38/TMEM64 family)